MVNTREGFQWTPASGLQSGLPCQGVIQPAQHIDGSTEIFDAIIVGAGYTGLTAARDMTVSGTCHHSSHFGHIDIHRAEDTAA
jgi:hypothetical protein